MSLIPVKLPDDVQKALDGVPAVVKALDEIREAANRSAAATERLVELLEFDQKRQGPAYYAGGGAAGREGVIVAGGGAE